MATDLKTYYSALLIAQYNAQPNAKGTIELLADEATAQGVAVKVRNSFNVDTAVGDQLDKLGYLIGASRSYYGAPIAKDYFVLAPYSDWVDGDPTTYLIGFYLYSDPLTFYYFQTYSDLIRPVYFLGDNDYRRMIRYVAKLNTIEITSYAVASLLDDTFGSVMRRDQPDLPGNVEVLPIMEMVDLSGEFPRTMDPMTMTYFYYFTPATVSDAFITAVVNGAIFPKPAGVAVTVTEIDCTIF
jgi:hypothetical protein